MDITKIKEKMRTTLGGEKTRTNLIILLAALAAVLIIVPADSCAKEKNLPVQNYSSDQYVQMLEDKLSQLISQVDGAGRTKVMVTLQSGIEYIYASEDSTSTDSSASVDASGRQSSDEREDRQTSYIIIDTDEGEKALVRTELMPSVSGVVVLCEGGGDPEIAQRIMAVVTTALDISSRRVCITQLSQ